MSNSYQGRGGQGRGGRPWQRKRKARFEMDHYLCQICLAKGITKAVELHGPNAGVCDHKKALAEGGTDDIQDLQTICQDCDRLKTQAEAARGRGAKPKEYSLSVGLDGWPLDPMHPANGGGGSNP